MSMVWSARRATDGQIDRLLAEPELIRAFVSGGHFHPGPPQRVGLLGRLLGMKSPDPPEPVSLPADWPELKEEDELYLDKTWHGIHFLLTGSDWEGDEPLCYVVKGGQEVGEIDVGYGPARALRSEQVKHFAEALDAVSDDELRQRFDPSKMAEQSIYPTMWDEGEGALDYLMEYVPALRSFASNTVEQGKGLVVWLA